MRKVALILVLAVLVPSLVLAWLAVRSLRDQQFILERQQFILYQRATDTLAKDISDRLTAEQQKFAALAEADAATNRLAAALHFDSHIRQCWPLADVGFSVTLSGPATCTITCPSPVAGANERQFLADNGNFLGNQESAEIYWNANSANGSEGQNLKSQVLNNSNSKAQSRVVNPQNQIAVPNVAGFEKNNLSKVTPAEAEFRQLIGDNTDGMLARFLQNQLKLMFWHRLASDPNLIFGAQLNLSRLVNELTPLFVENPDVWLVLLDDRAKAVGSSPYPDPQKLRVDLKHPFVATELGEALPHWEVAAYLTNPNQLPEAVRTAKLTLGLLIIALVFAIGIGGWFVVHCLNKELTLARQKTDFVSNVSHELKTPLTSIRMFSELIAEGRVTEATKQHSYLNIISSEAARLTRLIDNVLDFSRMERGEKKYNFQPCDLAEVTRNAVQAFRPHLEANGFKFDCTVPDKAIPVRGDCDALSQIIVNLLSNAEKYSNGQKEISLRIERKETPVPYAEIKVLDRGSGVPGGSEDKIFEKFYRAHDSLSSGIQGSGLGLTIARQIARAHGGDVTYEPREGGGSCFSLRVPIMVT